MKSRENDIYRHKKPCIMAKLHLREVAEGITLEPRERSHSPARSMNIIHMLFFGKKHVTEDVVEESADTSSKDTLAVAEHAEENAIRPTARREKVVKKPTSLMEELVLRSPNPPTAGDIVEGSVIALEPTAIYISLPPFGTGIIYGREFQNARDVVRKINIGDVVSAKVVDTEHKDGYIELSLKEARQALIWAEAEDCIKDKRPLDIIVKEANKGGLILEWQGIAGFLPASQLSAEHYPRVEGGDKDRILDELKKLVGNPLTVTIITAVPKEGKLIFSEKNLVEKDREKIIEKYAIGDEVEGTVTGIVDFGAFVKLEDGLEGLVHISEIDWGLVENPGHFVRVGDKIKVKIIEIKEGKVSLSIKALKENPWKEAAKKYKKDDTVTAVVIKYNRHGALASIEEGVAGLVHVSEFGSEDKLRETLELGKTYNFKITLFDPKEQKMALSFVEDKK